MDTNTRSHPPHEVPGPGPLFAARYAAAVFLGAFLLFQVQPLLAKAILPWFGGTPAVWTTCMLFFQVLLLGGYLYAHLITTKLPPRAQVFTHLALLLFSLGFLRILPSDVWRPSGYESPAWRILALLSVNIGVPYFVLAATSPLLQAWFRGAVPRRSPYRLYALSNAGSLLALLSYPFIFEPFLPLKTQAFGWAALYAAFALVCGLCAVSFLRSAGQAAGPAPVPTEITGTVKPEPPGLLSRSLWLVLAACASALLLATTNQLTQNVSVVPFLWIVPLSLYLFSFILCFDGERWYTRRTWTVFLGFACAGVWYVLYESVDVTLLMQILIYSLTLFIACMVCHGELAAHKPPPEHLTSFYVLVSAGGALGGLLVAVAAPLTLNGPWEYHLVWLLLPAVMLGILVREGKPAWRPGKHGYAPAIFLTLYGWFAYALYGDYMSETRSMVDIARNFYGTLTVFESDYSGSTILTLRNGQIDHGFQFPVEDARRKWPVSYYAPPTGVGVSVRAMRKLAAAGSGGTLNMGFVGLGAGIMAAWGRPGDRLTFYEINPLVVHLSGEYFSYRRDSRGAVKVVLGDARLSLEREAARAAAQPDALTLDALAGGTAVLTPSPPLDILVLDAFSGDAIPLHLLTSEAFKIYFKRLKSDGVLAVHVSNLFVDLEPLVLGLALERGKKAIVIDNDEDEKLGAETSTWVIVTGNKKFLADPLVRENIRPWSAGSKPLVFTDQYSNLFRLLRHD